MNKKIYGPISWYINKNPVLFVPDKDKQGTMFFANGYPLNKFIFSSVNDDDSFRAFQIKEKKLVKLPMNKIYVCDNPEHLNYTDASNHIVSNQAMRIALPKSIAQALQVKFNDEIKIIANYSSIICAYTDTQHDSLCRCGHHKDDHTLYNDVWDCMYCNCKTYQQRIGDLTKGAFGKLCHISKGLVDSVIEKYVP